MKRLLFAVVMLIIFAGCSQNSPSHFLKNGSAKYKLKNYTGAIEDLNRAIELKENYKEAHYLRALCYIQQGNLKSALKDFNTAIEIDSAYKEAYFSRAFYIRDKMGDYAGSIKDYNQYIRLNQNGDNAYALSNRGYAKYKQDDPEGAISDIEASLKIDPQNAWAYKNMALVFISLDSLQPACQNLQMALDHGYAKKYDTEVDSLMSVYCNN